jgi:hypothetical protein
MQEVPQKTHFGQGPTTDKKSQGKKKATSFEDHATQNASYQDFALAKSRPLM